MAKENIFDAYSIANQRQMMEIPEGVVLLKEGELNLDMYKVIEGHLEMYIGYGTNNEVLLGILGPGACFGEFGILLKRPAIYTIVTYSNVKLIRVTEGAMGDFVQENSDSIITMMRNMAGMMMSMQQNISQLSNEMDELFKENLELKHAVREINQEAPIPKDNVKPMDKKEMLKKYYIVGDRYYLRND